MNTTRAAAAPKSALNRGATLVWIMVGVGALAFLVRLLSVLRGGGLFSVSDYDGAVYFTGAVSLTFGRVPYADFVLLHPPGILLVLAPFAALGRIVSDPMAFAVARVAFMALGALNAVLLTRLAGRLGLVAAAVAGVFYAVWNPSLFAERTTLLEPLGTTALLVAMLLLFEAGRVSAKREFLAGLALGLGASVKIWGVVLIAVVVLWQLRSRNRKASARVVAGAFAGIAVVCLPFFLMAPGPMFRMVVLDQMERPVIKSSLVDRLASITSIGPYSSGVDRAMVASTVLLMVALVLVATLMICRQPTLRIVAVLLVTTGVVLLASPSYYRHYGEFVAAPLALTVAATAQQFVTWSRSRRQPIRTIAPAIIAAPLVVLLVLTTTVGFGRSVPWVHQDTVADLPGCVLADDPIALIEFNVLSSDLERGCHVWVDITGLTYDPAAKLTLNGRPVSRLANPVWQRDLFGYLSSGTAVVILKVPAGKLTHANNAEVRELKLLARSPNFSIFARR